MIEDDPLQSRVYERILVGGNYEAGVYGDPLVFLASTGASPPPDLLLIDILLPNLDGLSLCVRLAQDAEWCLVPAILMTSATSPDLLRAAERLPLPPEAVLAKPLDARALLRAVRRVLAAEDPHLRFRRLQRRRLSLTLRIQRDLLAGARIEENLPGTSDPTERPGDPEPCLVRLRAALETIEAEMDQVQATLLRGCAAGSPAPRPSADGLFGPHLPGPAGVGRFHGDFRSRLDSEPPDLGSPNDF
jgi:CheY-like chemotaxis protein